MMNKKVKIFFLSLLTMAVVLVSCGPKAPATPTADPNLIYTAAAQTADARLTEIFRLTPSATATKPATPTSDVNKTATAAAQTMAVGLTRTAAVTPAPQGTTTPPVPTTGPSNDKSVFVSDVTIPDGTVLAPGEAFVKTWKIQNAGLTTWTTAYSLVFVSGEQMGAPNSVPLTQSVAPGQQVDISVSMVAPTTTGAHQGYWKMKNSAGQFFNDLMYVLISVGSGGGAPSPTTSSSPSNPITSLAMSVTEGTYTGTCPHTFSFSATFTVNQVATLTYGLEAYSETPGFSFDLPAAQTNTFAAGTYSLSFPLEFTDSGTGWVRLRVTAPVDMATNQASFNLTCTP